MFNISISQYTGATHDVVAQRYFGMKANAR